ncbi:MAG: CSLREA domain-containing protein [Holophagales bacterium]|nr:MAG: CSLREA domain-containing protein [Holophagales bacterium]
MSPVFARSALPRPFRPRLIGRLVAALIGMLAAPLAGATIPVTLAADTDVDDGQCTLREAILAANTDAAYHGCPAGAGPDRIVFSVATPATIALSAGLPFVLDTLLLRGPGADLLTIDGQGSFRLLAFEPVSPNGWLGVEDLTLAHGLAESGGAVDLGHGGSGRFARVVFLENTSSNSGGALRVAGATRAELDDCWLSGNIALGPAGGGGVLVHAGAELAVDRSALTDNVAAHVNGSGGGLMINNAKLTLTRSTVARNSAYARGGGLSLYTPLTLGSFAEAVVHDSTIARNTADIDATGSSDDGGGIAFSGDSCGNPVCSRLELRNSIVADNADNGAIVLPDFAVLAGEPEIATVSLGFNLIGSNAGVTTRFVPGSPNLAADYVGTEAAPLAPALNSLALYGGATPSLRPRLDPPSPAIDHGYCPGSPGDQRDAGSAATRLRPFDVDTVVDGPGSDGCDIGAHERSADAAVENALFGNGFEVAATLLWSAESP